jgi:hypothetical protein
MTTNVVSKIAADIAINAVEGSRITRRSRDEPSTSS